MAQMKPSLADLNTQHTTVALCLFTQQPEPICSVAVIFRLKKTDDLLFFPFFFTGAFVQHAYVQHICVFLW